MSQNNDSVATVEDNGMRPSDRRDDAGRRATKPAPRLRAGVRAGSGGLGPDDEPPQLPPRWISDLWV